MDVYFGVMSCDPLKLDKSEGISMEESPISCNIFEACSIINPVLKLRYSSALLGYNYFYIPEWNRYYFMETPEVHPGEIAIIRGSEDYLYSSMQEIKELNADIIRQEFARSSFDASDSGKYVQDNEMMKSGKSYVRTREFTGAAANIFNIDVSSSYCYLMTVVGGINNSSSAGSENT